jgi:FKBP-type peptidyl-prolyl cis-trans isomerase SlyD
MKVSANHVVTINYTLKDNDNNVIDKSDDASFSYLHGASNIIPGLENALQGKASGDAISVSIAPEEGYGIRDEAKIQNVPRDAFPPDASLEPGMQFHAEGPEGQSVVVTVATVADDAVTVDANHPLAGMTLNFDVTVADIREASAEELEHGHVHGPHGHHHD